MHSYLPRVLSHISNKERSRQIEYELYDHLDERAQYWQAVGYAQEAAVQKAEAQMGDADIVGEQLDSIPRRLPFTVSIPLISSIMLLLATLLFKGYISACANRAGAFSALHFELLVSPYWILLIFPYC